MGSRTFIFAGGGTGGHLYPGIAIAQELTARDADIDCIFICSERPIDRRILGGAGARLAVIPAKTFSLRPLGLARFIGAWGPSVRASRRILKGGAPASQRASQVIAMGGFVAAPVVQAARAERIGITLVNLDAVPGKANRWIARHTERVVSAVHGAIPDDWEVVGPIVRREARADAKPETCRSRLGLAPDRKTLVVIGGSQGARSINAFMAAFAPAHAEDLEGWQVLHQCGEVDVTALAAEYERVGICASVRPFIAQMGDAWGAADLAVSRAGAGAIAELWANRVPCLLMPYPFHTDQHQQMNAQPLARAGLARVVADQVDAARNVEIAGEELARLLGNAAARDQMRLAAGMLGAADGARAVCDLLLADE